MKFYIAGPMRGIVNDNHEEFQKAEAFILSIGFTPVSPAKLALALGKTEFGNDSEQYIRQVMITDTVTICNCDAVVVLDGWTNSLGTSMEIALAQSIRIPIYKINEEHGQLEELRIPSCPWSSLVLNDYLK